MRRIGTLLGSLILLLLGVALVAMLQSRTAPTAVTSNSPIVTPAVLQSPLSTPTPVPLPLTATPLIVPPPPNWPTNQPWPPPPATPKVLTSTPSAPRPSPVPTVVGSPPTDLQTLAYVAENNGSVELRVISVDTSAQYWSESVVSNDRSLGMVWGFYPSLDGKYLAIEAAPAGEEEGLKLYVLDRLTGKMWCPVDKSIGCRGAFWGWTADDRMLIHPFDAAPGTLRVPLGAVLVDPITGKYTELDLPSDPRWGYSLADQVALDQDGTRVAYSTTHSANGEDVSEIWVMQLDGSDKQLVHREEGFLNLISWSPTGKQLLYFYQPRVEEYSPSELWLLNLDGSGKKLLTNRIRQASERRYRPAWSPDGHSIAVVQVDDVDKFLGDWREPGTNVYVINVFNGQSTKLSAFQGQNVGFPTWSPDGGQVAFVSGSITGDPRTGIKPPYAEILIARLNGTQLHPVSNSAVWRSALAWLRPY